MALINQHNAFKKQTGLRKLPINNSSFVSAFQYDADNQQLVVVLKTGGEYVYDNVPSQVFDSLIQCPSKGQFYSKYIKGKFEATRLIDKTVGPEEGQHGNNRVEGHRNARRKDAGTDRR